MEFCLAFKRNLQADYVRLSRVKVGLDFFGGKVAAVSVVAGSHFVFSLNFTDSLQALGVAKAVVGLAFGDQLFGVFFVKVKALALDVRAVLAALVAAFVPVNA